MATKYCNVKGCEILAEPLGSEKGGVALITFDMLVAYTGGTDTAQLGGGGDDGNVAGTSTLAAIIQNRRRDGKTVTLLGAAGGPFPGAQAAATNGPTIYVQSAAVATANVTLNLFSAATSGSAITTTTATWDRAASIVVTYTAV